MGKKWKFLEMNSRNIRKKSVYCDKNKWSRLRNKSKRGNRRKKNNWRSIYEKLDKLFNARQKNLQKIEGKKEVFH